MKARRKSRVRSLVMAAATVAAVGMVPSQASATPTFVEPTAAQHAVIQKINDMRYARGICTLGFDFDVQSASQSWTGQMAASGLKHNGLRPRGAGASAENVGMGSNPLSVIDSFTRSSKHMENMVDPRFDRIGVGVVEANGRSWVTLNFTASNSRGC